MGYPFRGHDALSGEAWYLSGGIAAADVAGVWQPKGAASLAASYLRLAGDEGYANLDPAVVGNGVAPGFGADGWIGNASSAFLDSGLVPQSTWSAVIRFSSASSSTQWLFGEALSSREFAISPYYTSNVVIYRMGGSANVASGLASGVLAITPTDVYRNGIDDGNISGWSGTNTYKVYFLARNLSGSPSGYFGGIIQAIAIYKTTITAAQAAAVSSAVALI